MPASLELEEIAAVRREIMELLRQQMETLDSPLGLSDERLSECYRRQDRVQDLRERLQALLKLEPVAGPNLLETSGSMETASCATQPPLASADAALGI
jgi:hypothetical protein